MHDADVKLACKGFCPCPSAAQLKKEKQAMRLAEFESKYRATAEKDASTGGAKPKVIFSPEVAKYKKELFGKKESKASNNLDLFTDKQRQRGYNDVLPEKKETLAPTGNICARFSINTRFS